MTIAQQAQQAFDSHLYKRHNNRRQEHLASLNLPIHGKSILEVGAGTGDHSSFFVDRECDIMITEARDGNFAAVRAWREPLARIAKSIGLTLEKPPTKVDVGQLDMDKPPDDYPKYDIIYNYGLLYHLQRPAQSLKFCADHCDLLLLETCISFGNEADLNAIMEKKQNITQSFTGGGCRPTRKWIVDELKKHFAHVYIPETQPHHPAFPINWNDPKHKVAFVRAVFIASKTSLDNPLLVEGIPMQQRRH